MPELLDAARPRGIAGEGSERILAGEGRGLGKDLSDRVRAHAVSAQRVHEMRARGRFLGRGFRPGRGDVVQARRLRLSTDKTRRMRED